MTPLKKKKRLSAKESATQTRLLLRRAQVIQLKLAGASFRQIAATLRGQDGISNGYNEASAHNDYHQEMARLDKLNEEAAEQARKAEIMRLDRYLASLNDAIDAGDPVAISTALKVGESRRKLLGLDAPSKVEATGKDGAPLEAAPIVVKIVRETAIPKASGE
jgi:hypothetical protein